MQRQVGEGHWRGTPAIEYPGGCLGADAHTSRHRPFVEGTRLDPAYDHLYNGMAQALLPRWNSLPGELEAFADVAARATRPLMGESLYARVAVIAYSHDREAAGRIYRFSWPRIRE
ncbi:MAG TPA: hypothetical protein VN203_15000, partial [Candidatus Acidoferrum sp.]|nr:hypothetical protein [Candidatus Acidoferrum sp.]